MKKILIIRFSSIGDIVLTSPVIRCLHNQLNGVEIHYLTKPQFAGILTPNPYLKQVHLLEDSLIATALKLKALGFDHIIDLHNNLRSRILSAIMETPVTRFNKLNAEKWMKVNLKWNALPDIHIVDRYMETVRFLGVQPDGEGLDYFIPPETALPVKLPEHYYAMAIGAQHFTKRMPLEKLIALCKGLNQPVVLLGGKEDRAQGEKISEAAGASVMNLCGELTLAESALVVRDAKKTITHDTGLMHIAAAYRKEIISIWGNTIPEFGMYPYFGNRATKQHIFEVSGLSCRPCSKIGFNTCPKGHFNCMQLQHTDSILREVNR